MMKKIIGKSLIAIAVTLALSPTVAAQSLKDVVIQTIESNPNVLTAVRRKDAADSAVEGAKSGYYPRIDWLWGTGREQTHNSTTRNNFPGQDYVHMNRKQEGVTLNQMLWDGLGTKSEVDRGEALVADDIFQQAMPGLAHLRRPSLESCNCSTS